MKQLHFVCVQPDDTYFTWQVHLWLESLREQGNSDKAIVLLFVPLNREQNPKWQQIIDLYPEAQFHFYKDDGTVNPLLGTYIPILRPYTLWKHFEAHPELEQDAIFYCDADIYFVEGFNVSHLIDDDVCYLSDSNSYINATYFDSKVRDVKPEMLEQYKGIDVLAGATALVGVSRQTAEVHNMHSGGAQYLLKGVNAAFWKKMMNDTMSIRRYLLTINRTYFENESKGFQSWCADMWGLLWNLWFTGKETRVVPEMNFAWAPDPVSKLDTHKIYHNAGIASTIQDGYPCFYKAKYHTGQDPFLDNQIDIVLNHEESKKHCTWYYTSKLKALKEKYNLLY